MVGFVAAHGDPLELLEFAKEILDQATPFVNVQINVEQFGAPLVLGDDDFCLALVEVRDNLVDLESLVGKEADKFNALDQERDGPAARPPRLTAWIVRP